MSNLPQIARTALTTSRLMEFCTVAELTKLVGVGPPYWPVAIVKELVDNALDACEEMRIAPEIDIAISTEKQTIAVTDNDPGIAADTVTRLVVCRTKTSSREAYVALGRGAQGNALQSLLAMPFALDGRKGETLIEACGVAHHITFGIDPVIQRPASVQFGTRITLHWPNSADRAVRRGLLLRLWLRSRRWSRSIPRRWRAMPVVGQSCVSNLTVSS